ncbi:PLASMODESMATA CALLOSE-BINDING PROTEIN 3 [Cucurbita argyrosperma subsp. argyrosperma]|uniref:PLASMODESMATA CALLOSE-BINDING PROTEIN 3-like n=2 Tax=Cucurbita TaxID=3660 RepID=A0A6J1F5D0_CUCMO|nr:PLASMODESMATA CALLOSE-BINDING PROTEIN 3-like [Cucurbita moschata]KAG7021544.1 PLASMODESMATA CALLOSE-BINDING PROTEIN 3 [Cucurbita argyrosperma subsp. argyrosperma]
MSCGMPVLAIGLLILAMTGHSRATWCVCKSGLGDAALQKTLDYACGAGADCVPIHQNGGCFLPNTVEAHCSYAANSYFQRKGQAPGSCDFSGTAMVTTTNPSISGCVYPSSASPVNSGTIPVSGTPTTTNPGTGFTPTTTTNTPFGSTTPTGGVMGGNGFGTGSNGLGPPGVGGMNTDYSDSGSRLQLTLIANVLAFLFALMFFNHMV